MRNSKGDAVAGVGREDGGGSRARTPAARPSRRTARRCNSAWPAMPTHARHEELQQELEERKAYFKAMKEANREDLKAAKAEWKAWKETGSSSTSSRRNHGSGRIPGEKGGPDIQLLRCEPRDYEADAAIIGPEGGTMHVGEHQLVIPKGRARPGGADLGRGARPRRWWTSVRARTASNSSEPAGSSSRTRAASGRPSASSWSPTWARATRSSSCPRRGTRKLDDEVEADIEHFSRYAVAW